MTMGPASIAESRDRVRATWAPSRRRRSAARAVSRATRSAGARSPVPAAFKVRCSSTRAALRARSAWSRSTSSSTGPPVAIASTTRPYALLNGVPFSLDRRPALARRTLALTPKGDRPGDGIAEEAIVEAGADSVDEGGVEHFTAEERPVRADRWPAPIACGAAIEPRRPPLRARPVRARDGPDRPAAPRAAGEVRQEVGRGIAGRLDRAARERSAGASRERGGR